MDQAQLRRLRDQVLRLVYVRGAGSYEFSVPIDDIMSELGMSQYEFSDVWALLRSQRLSSSQALGGCLGLNSAGQHEAEGLGVAVPMRDATTFSPITINNHSGIVQIGGAGSTQSATLTITEFSRALDELQSTIEASGTMPAPDKVVSRGLIDVIRDGVGKMPEIAVQSLVRSLTEIVVRNGLTVPGAIAGMIAG
jgi:hypothetical protein